MESIASTGSGKRPNFPIEFKVSIAARACEPGVSVSKLAREHDLNTNMVFRWRRQYRAGELRAAITLEPALLPVSLAAESNAPLVELPNPATRFGGVPAAKAVPSAIEIRVADVLVRIEGDVDVVRLRAVLTALRG